jgi:hypothetical protein
MRLFLVLTMLFVSGLLPAQNQAINNPINLIENNDQQLIAINNQPKLNNIQINLQANEAAFNMPRLLKPQSAGLSVSSSSSSVTSSGVSTKSTHHKTIKMLTSGSVVKHFDKKVSNHQHYKKKGRIKRCASF